MDEPRAVILDWVEQGRLRHADLPAALRIAGVAPQQSDWRRFLEMLTLWLGVVFCAAAVVFFLAYNWQDMGRFAKFGMVQLLLVASLALCWQLGLDRMGGKAALLLASLLTGALLALVGQTYQTGADTHELFAAWALAVLPWAAVGRFAVLWLLWLGLVNLALILYFGAFGWFDGNRLLWALLALNTVALVAVESAGRCGIGWLRERWPPRIVAVASGGSATLLVIWTIVARHDASGWHPAAAWLAYLAWMAAAYACYRRRAPDIFMLAGGVLSAIAVVTAWLGRYMSDMGGGAFLLIGLVVIGLSAAGGLWLKSIASEEQA